jgi:hypothetical protein
MKCKECGQEFVADGAWMTTVAPTQRQCSKKCCAKRVRLVAEAQCLPAEPYLDGSMYQFSYERGEWILNGEGR